MALRVLSGVIFNEDGPVQGSVEIGFNPHAVISAPPRIEVVKMRTVGPSGRYSDVPAEHVALREINFRTLFLSSGHIRNFIDTVTTPDQITISWSKGSRSIGIAPEISYMIIGDIGDDSVDGDGNSGGGDPIRPPGPVVNPVDPGIGVRPPGTLPDGEKTNKK